MTEIFENNPEDEKVTKHKEVFQEVLAHIDLKKKKFEERK
jgi:hypothetical protein